VLVLLDAALAVIAMGVLLVLLDLLLPRRRR
jgi:hypothetical protein